MAKEQITIEQVKDFAELAGGYEDDFGRWTFREADYLCKFADIILAAQESEINNMTTTIQILKTDLEAAEVEIRELRRR